MLPLLPGSVVAASILDWVGLFGVCLHALCLFVSLEREISLEVGVLSPTLGTNWYTFYIRLGYTFRTQSWNIFLSIIALWLAF